MNFVALPHAILLRVTGKHSGRYLQARLTNDLRLLSSSQAILAAALTPQGRTEGFFQVLLKAENDYLLMCDGGVVDNVISGLKRFLVAEQVLVEDLSKAYSCFHFFELHSAKKIFPALENIEPKDLTCVEQDGLRLVIRNRLGGLGLDVLARNDHLEPLLAKFSQHSATSVAIEQYNYIRIHAGIPAFPGELNSDHLFSESGLMQAVSFTKGCYTGQEVVAKIDSQGKTPRILAVLSATTDQTPAKGSDIYASHKSEKEAKPRLIGEVLSSAHSTAEKKVACFADLKNIERLDEFTFVIDGREHFLEKLISATDEAGS